MNEIENLTKQEKSVLLAKAMGKPFWIIRPDMATMDMKESTIINIYKPIHMALAWTCLNWAWQQTKTLHEKRSEEWIAKIDQVLVDYWCGGGDRAQCAWLDKILELAIEARLVELEEEKE